MLKARAGDLIVLGLSKQNIRNLKEGNPIYINHPDFGKVFIFYGDTEAKMKKALAPLIDDETEVTDEIH